MSTTIVRLWFVRQTDKARLYCKFPPAQLEVDEADALAGGDLVWVPLSIIEHTTKRGIEHQVKLPDWFIEKRGL